VSAVTAFEKDRPAKRRRFKLEPTNNDGAGQSPLFSCPDAEDAVLSAMLFRESAAIAEARAILDESDFELNPNRLTFRAICQLADAEVSIDPITLSAQLGRKGDLEAVGGKDRISFLIDAVPTAANIRYHAELVKRVRARRQARDLAQQVITELSSPDGDPAAAFQAIREFSIDGEEASTASGLPIYDDDELIALPAPCWDVPGVIPRNSLVQMHGPYGAGKTFAALDLNFHRALGLAWHGLAVSPGPCFYVAAEGSVGMRARIAGLRKYSGVDRVGLYFIPQPVQVNGDAQVDQLIAAVKRRIADNAEPWVTIDTRTRCFVGNENSTEDMSAFVRGCDRIRQETNATVIVLHHPGWGNEDRGRGAYDFDASCDTIIRVERDAERVTLTCKKQKDGPDFPPLAFEMLPAAGTLVLKAVELNAGKLTGQRLKVLRTLHQNSTDLGSSYKAWLEATTLKPSSFKKARDWLSQQVYVKATAGKWKMTDAGILALHSTDSTDTPSALHSESDNQSELQLHRVGGTVSTHGGVARESV
jgi:AAA domain/DnaB-like helicase N terminal domain